MKIELNPLKWFAKSSVEEMSPEAKAAIAVRADASATVVSVTSNSAKAVENVMSNKFVSVLEAIGKDFEKGLAWAVTYAVPVERLVGLIFPAAAPVAGAVANATALIQNAVILVEQKYAASGAQNGTGKQKLAEVVTLAGSAVMSLLSQAGINADSSYVESLISAVVAILNVQQATPALAPSTASVAAA